jgi:uncharacterized protein YjlB
MTRDSQPARSPVFSRFELIELKPRDWVPNNPRLPVILYRQALNPDANNLGAALEDLFARNQWPPQWRDSIFDYHHFHSTQSSAGRFKCVGAYPDGQQWDIRREALSEEERAAMLELPFPRCDPVGAEAGPLCEHWR